MNAEGSHIGEILPSPPKFSEEEMRITVRPGLLLPFLFD
jgi:hypothetical protein